MAAEPRMNGRKTFGSVTLAVVLLLPFFVAVGLFESWIEAKRFSAEGEARRVLAPAASYLGYLAQPGPILWDIFTTEFPSGCPWIKVGEVASISRRIRRIFEDALGSGSASGIRVFVLNHIGDPEDPGPEAASMTLMQTGAFKQQGKAGGGKLVEVSQEILRQRFGPFITHQDYLGIGEFQLVCETAFASRTFVMRDNPMEGRSVIHVEIDETVIDFDRFLEICVKRAPPEIGIACIIDETGSMSACIARPPFLEGQNLPIPLVSDQTIVADEGFFLKRSLPGYPGKTLLIGSPAPWVIVVPWEARVACECAFLVLAVLLAWHGMRWSADGGWNRLPLIWRLVCSLVFAAIVPLLVLAYFGTVGALQTRQVQEATWETRINHSLRQFDLLFRNRTRRTAERFKKARQFLEKGISGGQPLLNSVLPGEVYQQYAMDLRGNFAYNKFGDRRTFRSNKLPTFERLYYAMMNRLLKTILRIREGEVKDGGEDLALMAIVGDDNPLLSILRHPGRFHEMGFSGMFMQICIDLVPGADGRPLGALLMLFDLAYVSRVCVWRFSDVRCEPGSGVFSYITLNQRYYPKQFGQYLGLPALIRQVIQTGLPDMGPIETGSGSAICWVKPGNALEDVIMGGTVLTGKLDEAGKRDSWLIGLAGFATLLVLLVSVRGFRAAILSPVQALHEGAASIGEGDFGKRIPVLRNDELGELGEAFNRMAEGLQQQERMRRFISAGTWNTVGSSGSVAIDRPRQFEGAVLFSDIRGFTTLSESISPEQVILLLNDYFTAMDKIIRRNGGMIDKLIGDAILAVFKPIPDAEDPARRAVIAGLSIRAALSHFNRRRQKLGQFTIDNGVGIHYGPITEGMIGSSHGRRDLTVIGRTVSRASLLEGVSKKGHATRVVVSPELAARLGDAYPLLRLEGSEELLYEIDRPWTESMT